MERAATGPISSPRFHVPLSWLTGQRVLTTTFFFHALPILGKDGTLAKIQTQNPAAGHVFAKTRTFLAPPTSMPEACLTEKGLAGYVITKSGRKIAFAAYLNHVAILADPEAAQNVGGQALGEIAAAAYDAGL